MSEQEKVPVLARGGYGHRLSEYWVYGEYDSLAEAAAVVRKLRESDTVAWAHVPDEYAEPPKGAR